MHNNLQVGYLLQNTVIFVIPIVNYDAFNAIGEQWNKTGTINYFGKNRHIYPNQNTTCNINLIGVDLSRNYDYSFGSNNVGSSPNICDDQYRGPFAFSEPETQAIRNFISNNTNILVVINLFAYGNSFNIPFSFDNQ